MKYSVNRISRLLSYLFLGSICFAGEPVQDSSINSKAEVTSQGIVSDIRAFPEEYFQAVDVESEKAQERLDPRLTSWDYINRESRDVLWDRERDPFYELDSEKSEDLARDIFKDGLRESIDSLPTIGRIVHNVRGFIKETFQFSVSPKTNYSIPEGLPAEAEQELRKKALEDKEAVTVSTRGTLKQKVHGAFGPQTDFRTGFDVGSLREIEYFVKLKNPDLIGSRLTELRLGYTLGMDESTLRAEVGKKIGEGVYLTVEAEQPIASGDDSNYGLRIQRELREHDSVSLRVSTSREHGAYAGVEYRAALPGCKPVRDIKKFFLGKR